MIVEQVELAAEFTGKKDVLRYGQRGYLAEFLKDHGHPIVERIARRIQMDDLLLDANLTRIWLIDPSQDFH